MQTILLDTDYVIDFLRGKESVRELIFSLLEENNAYISILTVYELYAGMRTGEEQATGDFIQACRIEPITPDIAKKAGIFRFTQRQRGITLSIVDCIIAETARVNNHLVATMNKKHYPGTSFLV